VLKALESYVDDNGVGEDDVNVLVGDCFLHDLIREPSRTLAKVSEAISHLHQAGLVWRYEANDRNLLYVSFWETVQRIDKAQAGRNPRPDGTLNYKDSVIRESVATPREESLLLAPVTGEQGNRGTGEQGNSSLAHPAVGECFEEVWRHWPKKDDKKDALAKWPRAVKESKLTERELADVAIAHGDAHKDHTEARFIPAFVVWLNKHRWANAIPTAQSSGRPVTSVRVERMAGVIAQMDALDAQERGNEPQRGIES